MEVFLKVLGSGALDNEMKVGDKRSKMGCLILDDKAKVSHQNSTKVQTIIIMRRET